MVDEVSTIAIFSAYEWFGIRLAPFSQAREVPGPVLTLATVSNATVVTGTAVVREGRVDGEERGWLCACVAHFERGGVEPHDQKFLLPLNPSAIQNARSSSTFVGSTIS